MWISHLIVDRSTDTGHSPSLPIPRRPHRGVLFLLALCVALPLLASPIDDLAQQGDLAYRDGDYLAAIDAYTRVLASGYTSGPLLFNLGNAHFKAGHLGASILYYERAGRAMPHNRDVRYNLELARSRTIDRIDPPPRLPIWNLLDWVRDLVAPGVTALAAWMIALLAAISFTLMLLIRSQTFHKLLRVSTVTLTVLFVLTIAFVGLRIAADHADTVAIVLADEINLHSAPDPTSLTTLTLHEGTKVNIVKVLGDWQEVRLADGRQGWMPSVACEVI